MFRDKKGQVTLFVIIGIIILLVAGVFIYARDNEPGTDIVDNILDGRNDASLEGYVKHCMSNIAEDAVMQIAIQGGYKTLTPPYFSTPQIKAPYYLKKGVIKEVPSIKEVEANLAAYMFLDLNSCVGEFEGVKNHELINMTPPIVTANIEEDDVVFVVDYNAYFSDGENIIEIPAISYSYSARIPSYLNASEYIVDAYLYEQKVNYDMLLSVSEENDFSIVTFESGLRDMAFVLIDNKEDFYFKGEKPAIYVFSIQGGLI